MNSATTVHSWKPGGSAGATHTTRDIAQVTAPGGTARMIAAVSSRPHRPNRSTRSSMLLPPQYTSKSIGWKAGHGVAHVMAVSKGSAIARPIPMIASFSMYVPLLVLLNFMGNKNRDSVSYFTLRIIIILMETIKKLYKHPRTTPLRFYNSLRARARGSD
jgi:hypothetical protein